MFTKKKIHVVISNTIIHLKPSFTNKLNKLVTEFIWWCKFKLPYGEQGNKFKFNINLKKKKGKLRYFLP